MDSNKISKNAKMDQLHEIKYILENKVGSNITKQIYNSL